MDDPEKFTEIDGCWWAIVGGELQVVKCQHGQWWAFNTGSPVYLDKIGPKIDPPAVPTLATEN